MFQMLGLLTGVFVGNLLWHGFNEKGLFIGGFASLLFALLLMLITKQTVELYL